ncbi:hypothetical protein QR77_35480 [Streptomyces sp. 150FB]|uniref:hypothetical protein n=1 Tax=Streptomyces sp. 150FB TaxID=1576605 RepID=UPI0005892FDC|nr:hypothetical protein [Streptomyces sp. 150FB]KIF77707.1 hypothetical protein QR77_35480 [Streptomyces sp. 150FB]
MSEAELATQALVAGVTAGVTETVRRVGRNVWDGLISLTRRGRSTAVGEERSAGDPGEGIGQADKPDRDVPKYTVSVYDGKGVLVGDKSRQTNHFH